MSFILILLILFVNRINSWSPGQPCPIRCFVNPCTVSSCPHYPSAECSGDCCTAPIWTDTDGTIVTDICQDDPCLLDPDSGPCEAAIPTWYNNVETGKCEQFLWGGCQGNENNFPTKAICNQQCRAARGP
eukprot:63561_1